MGRLNHYQKIAPLRGAATVPNVIDNFTEKYRLIERKSVLILI